MTAIRALCVILALMFSGSAALAQSLFGVVSERNSATVAAAAKAFEETYPDARIDLRTPRQLNALSDAKIVESIAQSDVLFVAGVFSDDAERLRRLITTSGKTDDIYVVSSTRDLIALSRDSAGNFLNPQDDTGGNLGPQGRIWNLSNAYWQARGVANISNLFAALLFPDRIEEIAVPKPLAPIRFAELVGSSQKPTIAVVDYDTGDQAGNADLHDLLCRELVAQGASCQSVYADWGAASADAIEQLSELDISGVVLLQDFAIGGSEQGRAEEALAALDVPILKGIRLVDVEEKDWRAGTDGLPTDSVYYRVAMPELVGASQPLVLAVGAAPKIDPVSGIEIRVTEPVDAEVAAAARRLAAWTDLQHTRNEDKRLAIIYYNHPPGRHNIGADNLDVPASLFEILKRLQTEGYDVGVLPDSKEALLDLILERAVNLPEDGAALAKLSSTGFSLPIQSYQKWLEALPDLTRAQLTAGPLAALQIQIANALAQQDIDRAERLAADTVHDMAFVIEGAPAEYHEPAEDLLDQLETHYEALIRGEDRWSAIETVSEALMNQGIEGLKGWGEAPGRVMTHNGEFVLPGLRFGNVVIAPQPPRGWEVNEEVLHANMSVPPTHQYLAFYHWLHSDFDPHAIIHLGRHSTYEFLPGKRVGLPEQDYSRLIAGDVPGLYPYIVDGVGEGIQAKRRGLAVIVDHLTPPLQATPLYDELLGLRHLVESFEAADPSTAGDAARTQSLNRIKALVVDLGIKDGLVAELEAEHGGGETIEFETIPPDLLVHEVGHYLTEIQEDFMPLGLHVFGKKWSEEAVETMLASMGSPQSRSLLEQSPSLEMAALMQGLNGRFVRPGKGNDPLRSPDALPTGRNFFGLDSSLIPNVVAWDIGAAMADTKPQSDDNQAVVLWASDAVRDGGVMIAFGMKLMGIKPVWNGRGIVTGLERLDGPREDVSFVASGLFRDLYGEQIKWLDRAALLALDGASLTIREDYPELQAALDEALAPLGELRDPGRDSLAENRIAAFWVSDMQSKKTFKVGDGRTASLRIFAPAPGRYGAGINRLAERSGAWDSREELANSYIARMGHAYGVSVEGEAQQAVFVDRLGRVNDSYLGRASNLYGLVDNNDAFDYLGGLNLAVESVRGQAAKGYVVDVSDPENPETTPLASAIVHELRGRQLNPNWIRSLMPHGYAGARTMNAAFFENLWGWEATDPDLFPDNIWEDAKDTYIDDRYNLGLERFFDEARHKPVEANILAIMLVAAHKGYWQADDETIAELGERFASTVIETGLPGSGHTRPDHPMLDWLNGYLPEETAGQLAEVRNLTRPVYDQRPEAGPSVETVAEQAFGPPADSVLPEPTSLESQPSETIRELLPAAPTSTSSILSRWWVFLPLLLLVGIGIFLGRRFKI
ncbi:MAG: cobaltochelatase subunit CobN [Pseudomonadota bacterium]